MQELRLERVLNGYEVILVNQEGLSRAIFKELEMAIKCYTYICEEYTDNAILIRSQIFDSIVSTIDTSKH